MLIGLIVYWIGTFAMVIAALMSGIVGPQLAEYYQQASENQIEVFRGLFLLQGILNQAFAKYAVFCWCASICFWACDMFKQSKIIKLFGIVSLLAAITIAMSLLAGWLVLQIFGMTLVLVVICAWQLGIACLLFSQSSQKS